MLWHGQDPAKGELSLGLSLATAQAAPDFAFQWLDCGLFEDRELSQLAPLDDLKQWLRATAGSDSVHFDEVRAALLAEEEKARAAAQKAGEKFDLVDYELNQLQSDNSYERFDPLWTRALLGLYLDEADSLNAFSRSQYKANSILGVSFTLPPAWRHPEISAQIAKEQLAAFGAPAAEIERALRKNSKVEWTGALQLELVSKGMRRDLSPVRETAFVEIKLTDPRVTDLTDLSLCLAYPRAWEGYFLAHFDKVRQRLGLKDIKP